MKRHLAKIVALVFTAALAACIMPASALATTVNVNVISSGTTQTAQVDLEGLNVHSGKLGFLFNKNAVWNVVGTRSYVKLSDVLEAGGAPATYSYITVCTTDCPSGYIKYNSGHFTYAEMTASAYYFYGNTTFDTLVTPYTNSYDTGAIIALSNGSMTLSGTMTATQALNTMSYTSDTAPRLVWGFLSSTGADSTTGGNRFPRGITDINVYTD